MNDSRRPSERLREVARRDSTVGAIADALGPDAPFLLLLLLAGLALVPGAAPVFAAAMVVIASGVCLGRGHLLLPARLRAQTVPPATLARAVERLARFERRFGIGTGRSDRHARPAALLVIWNAVLVILPIPLGNGPPAIAALLVSLGVVEQNRRALALGIAATVAATLFEVAVLWVGVDLVEWLWVTLGL